MGDHEFFSQKDEMPSTPVRSWREELKQSAFDPSLRQGSELEARTTEDSSNGSVSLWLT